MPYLSKRHKRLELPLEVSVIIACRPIPDYLPCDSLGECLDVGQPSWHDRVGAVIRFCGNLSEPQDLRIDLYVP